MQLTRPESVKVHTYLFKMSNSTARLTHNHGQGGQSGGGPMKVSYFPFCPEITKYEKMAKVGEGTFG